MALEFDEDVLLTEPVDEAVHHGIGSCHRGVGSVICDTAARLSDQGDEAIGSSGQIAGVQDGISAAFGDVCEGDEVAHVGVALTVLRQQRDGRRRLVVSVVEHQGHAGDWLDAKFIRRFGKLERAGDVVAVYEGERVVPEFMGTSEHLIGGRCSLHERVPAHGS